MCATRRCAIRDVLDDPFNSWANVLQTQIFSTFNFDGKVLRKEFLGLFHLEAVVVVIYIPTDNLGLSSDFSTRTSFNTRTIEEHSDSSFSVLLLSFFLRHSVPTVTF